MKKKILIPLILVILALIGGIAYLMGNLEQQKQVNRDMQELAELDKQEMENEYERFALQYSEMKTQINNDSIVEQLTQEQMKTQKLLEELKKVKADDAREITRLKKELATSDAAIATVCRRCGFGSENHPKKLFRERFNMTMRDFRTQGNLQKK